MGELSRSLLVSNGNITSVVRQLEADDYVTSRAAPDDRRSSIVRLTEAGQVHFATLAAAHRKWIGAMFARVPQTDQVALYGLLATLKASIALDQAGNEE